MGAGTGERMDSEIPKQFIEIERLPIIIHSYNKLKSIKNLDIIIVLPEKNHSKWKDYISNFIDERFSNLTNLQKIEKISLKMDHGFISHSYLFIPDSGNGKLIIYHQGHSGGFINGKQSIQDFLNAGFSIAAFSMPLTGINNQPTINIENRINNSSQLVEEELWESTALLLCPLH